MRKYDLEDRLINFAISVIEVANSIQKNSIGRHLGDQLMRSGTSSALNYGEAQDAESKKDFIHKIKVIQKELRETNISLKIIYRIKLANAQLVEGIMKENIELLAIFAKSIKTARANIES